MAKDLFNFCISTILDQRKLEQFALKGRGQATEGLPWKTGRELFTQAQDAGADMPVIFSDAAHNTETLLLWAILREISIDGDQTTFRFTDAKRIPGNHHRTELVLRSSGREIAPNYIRPYAICRTPPFIK
jgi:hypothetical protein